jgi:hypothetical protein
LGTIKLVNVAIKYNTIHTKSAPSTPQQNSIAEHFNHTILEMATCMMQHNKVEEKFWGYAVLYANKIQNHLPSQSIENKIPYFIWNNKNPNLKHYNIFGSNVFNLIEKPDRNSKFSSHSNECLYLGIESDHGTHILYNYNSKRIICSHNVRFIFNKENNSTNLTNFNSSENKEIYEIVENSNTDNKNHSELNQIKNSNQNYDANYNIHDNNSEESQLTSKNNETNYNNLGDKNNNSNNNNLNNNKSYNVT